MWLVLVAAINSTVSLYYYLRVITAAYLAPPDGRPPVALDGAFRWVGGIAIVIILLAGIYPKPLWDLAQRASSLLVGG